MGVCSSWNSARHKRRGEHMRTTQRRAPVDRAACSVQRCPGKHSSVASVRRTHEAPHATGADVPSLTLFVAARGNDPGPYSSSSGPRGGSRRLPSTEHETPSTPNIQHQRSRPRANEGKQPRSFHRHRRRAQFQFPCEDLCTYLVKAVTPTGIAAIPSVLWSVEVVRERAGEPL